MMRLWKTSYVRPASTRSASAVSVAGHAVIIAIWVISTLPVASLPSSSLSNRVYYIPPPNKPILPRETHEVVRYLTLMPGIGNGPGPTAIDEKRPSTSFAVSREAGGERADTTKAAPPPTIVGNSNTDSVFTELDVDSAVVRSQTSAAPAYPLDLLAKRVEGTVVARYVVDTTGFADTLSFEVVRSTHPGFIRSVREALPYMRFSPAKIGANKVRQLVEQPFTFRIAPTVAGGAKP